MRAELDQALDAIRKQYGDTSVHYGRHEHVARIQTGSLELDLATGGGIPIGRITRLWGAPMSGKSLLAWQVIKYAQAGGRPCAYYNIEKQMDSEYTAGLGVDVGKLLVVEGSVIEEVGTKLEVLLGSVDVHVLDSCSSAVSIDEIDSKIEDWHMGLGPRAWGKVLRRTLERLDPQRNVVIMIDQARDTFGAFKGGEHPPGGKMMEHSSSMTIHFKRGAHLWRDAEGLLQSDFKKAAKPEAVSGFAAADGFEVQAFVKKSRVCRPGRSARIYYDFDATRFDAAFEFMKASIFYEIVQKNGTWFVLPDGTKVQGEGRLRQAIIADKKLRKTIYDEAMKHV